MLRPRKYKALESALGYKFKSVELLERALTHSSVHGGKSKRHDHADRIDNERLEFIGDRVLGLAISERLLDTYPADNEGDLARRFNVLVRGETCGEIGRRIGLGAHLILSASEADSGGRDKTTILADAMEAVLGAVFRDGGYAKAKSVVYKLWLDTAKAAPDVVVDAKSALQEWAQGQSFDLPTYKVVSREGPDHAPHFIAEVTIKGRKGARGEGASKRLAQQAAAEAFLSREGVRTNRKNG